MQVFWIKKGPRVRVIGAGGDANNNQHEVHTNKTSSKGKLAGVCGVKVNNESEMNITHAFK